MRSDHPDQFLIVGRQIHDSRHRVRLANELREHCSRRLVGHFQVGHRPIQSYSNSLYAFLVEPNLHRYTRGGSSAVCTWPAISAAT